MLAGQQDRTLGKVQAFKPTPHPLIPLPTAAQVRAILAGPDGMTRLQKIFADREAAIAKEREDPFRHGYEPTSWKRADAQVNWDEWINPRRTAGRIVDGFSESLLLGGNRSSKTEYKCKRAMQVLVLREASRVLMLHTNEKTSIRDHHTVMWKYMPPEFRDLKKDRITNIAYRQKTGFAENSFVLPNRAQCFFGNYAQLIDTVEGGEYDLVITDELVPLPWLKTLRYRIVTRAGRMFNGFTPIEGYSAAVKSLLTAVRTIEDTEAELLPTTHKDGTRGFKRVPLVQHRPAIKPNPAGAVVYFHTKENPYGNYPALKQQLKGAAEVEILVRAYGVPTRRLANKFPKFRGEWHTFKREQMPKKGTRFHVVDPCSGRTWFMIWFLVETAPVGKRYWIYREWPSPGVYIPGVGDPGPWAEPGEKEDGDAGSAQTACQGWGLIRYKAEIARLEGWHRPVDEDETLDAMDRRRRKSRFSHPERELDEARPEADEMIHVRWMDSRYGASPTVRADATTTLIDECAEIGLYFEPSSGRQQDIEGENWIQLINDLLDWKEQEPRNALNSPRLFVEESCQNLIFALENWTGIDGKHGATKDPIDTVKYAVLSDADDFEGDPVEAQPGGVRRARR